MLSLDPCMERFLGGGKEKAGWSVHTCHYMTCVSLLQCSHVGQTCKQDQLYIVFPEAGFEISVEPIDSHLICCHLQELLYFLILTGFMKHLKALKGIYIHGRLHRFKTNTCSDLLSPQHWSGNCLGLVEQMGKEAC